MSIQIPVESSIYLDKCLNNCLNNIEFDNCPDNKNILQMNLYVNNEFKDFWEVNIVFKDLVLPIFADIGDVILY